MANANDLKTWGGTRISIEEVARHVGRPEHEVHRVLEAHDDMVSTLVGLDHMVLVFPPVHDSSVTWVPLINDYTDVRVEAVRNYNEQREKARLAGRWDERPRLGDLYERLNEVATDELDWMPIDELFAGFAEDTSLSEETVKKIVQGFWSLAIGDDDIEDWSFYSGRHWRSESELEQDLVENLGDLADLGFDFELWTDDAGRSGRQYTLANRGRPDLICRDRDTGGVCVIELKAFPCQPCDIAQLERYLSTLRQDHQIEAQGLLITNGTTVKAREALKGHATIRHLNVEQIGLGPIED